MGTYHRSYRGSRCYQWILHRYGSSRTLCTLGILCHVLHLQGNSLEGVLDYPGPLSQDRCNGYDHHRHVGCLRLASCIPESTRNGGWRNSGSYSKSNTCVVDH